MPLPRVKAKTMYCVVQPSFPETGMQISYNPDDDRFYVEEIGNPTEVYGTYQGNQIGFRAAVWHCQHREKKPVNKGKLGKKGKK